MDAGGRRWGIQKLYKTDAFIKGWEFDVIMVNIDLWYIAITIGSNKVRIVLKFELQLI